VDGSPRKDMAKTTLLHPSSTTREFHILQNAYKIMQNTRWMRNRGERQEIPNYGVNEQHNVGNTRTTERGGGGESVVYKLKQFYAF
jgi:hypothetical protein